MVTDKTGIPAFPVQDASNWQAHGMTLRDYFAARVLQSVISDRTVRSEVQPGQVAIYSYEIADAMLKARES